jgi:hypothetical protein
MPPADAARVAGAAFEAAHVGGHGDRETTHFDRPTALGGRRCATERDGTPPPCE